MQTLSAKFISSIETRLKETDFNSMYKKVEEDNKWLPEDLNEKVLMTLYLMEDRKRMDECPKLNGIHLMLQDKDEHEKLTKDQLLYIITYLDRLNNTKPNKHELNLYN